MPHRPKPLILLILDGFGLREEIAYNAIKLANTPCWDALQKNYPMTAIDCSGDVVGLPSDQMGNSEVGHLHIGGGRLMRQELSRVSHEIETGEFFANPVLNKAVDLALEKQSALHVLGLLSPGGVHSHETHIAALLRLAAERGLKKIYLHAFLDGRDVPPRSAAASLEYIENTFRNLGAGQFATVGGRFYGMDRDNRWERVEQAYRAIVRGEAEYVYPSAAAALEAAYARGENDEFVAPSLIAADGQAPIALHPDDSVVFMNFRADRAREISQAITLTGFDKFERGREAHPGYFATLTEYNKDFGYPVVYPSEDVKNSIGEVISNLGMKQLRIAETEKYAHVTFFLNGGRDEAYPGENRILIPSPKIKTYDLQPEMSAPEVTDRLVEAIRSGEYDIIFCNYANCDMVGHTGVLDAAIKAVEAVDACLQRVVDATLAVGGQILLTADHGNIEQMLDEETGQPHTQHTTNLVPLVYIGGDKPLLDGGNLADLAPTMLNILGQPQPREMTGRVLL